MNLKFQGNQVTYFFKLNPQYFEEKVYNKLLKLCETITLQIKG